MVGMDGVIKTSGTSETNELSEGYGMIWGNKKDWMM